MKVVIVGGVAGGASAAARLRRLDETMDIVIFEKSGYISYANCGLPYYIGGAIKEEEALLLQTPESFHQRFRIDVRVQQEVISIDVANKKVFVKKKGEKDIYQESYDKLILSPGAKAILPPIEGIDSENVFSLRTVEDTFKIDQFMKAHKVSKALVVGAGFIGLEMAENLKERNVDVTIVQLTDHVLATLDKDMAAVVHNYVRSQGITLMLETSLQKIIYKDQQAHAIFDNGDQQDYDLVIMAVGVQPDSQLAKKAGAKMGLRDAISVNASMETSLPDVYAIGDVVEVDHFVTKRKSVISLAGPANKQGRIVANHICGVPSTYQGSQGSSILKLFDVQIASTGIHEIEAKHAGIDYDYVVLTSASHATYYPQASYMFIKVLFEKSSGRILGGQIVGGEGVDKRIDVLATAIRAKMTAYDLTELDLAYAPPFSSAKDPINMAGYVIENLLLDKVDQVHWEQVVKQQEQVQVIDTRTKGEYNRGHIEHALHIPVDELRDRLEEIPKDKDLYIYCQSGLRSYLACRLLKAYGWKCFNVSGGYGFYEHTLKDENAR